MVLSIISWNRCRMKKSGRRPVDTLYSLLDLNVWLGFICLTTDYTSLCFCPSEDFQRRPTELLELPLMRRFKAQKMRSFKTWNVNFASRRTSWIMASRYWGGLGPERGALALTSKSSSLTSLRPRSLRFSLKIDSVTPWISTFPLVLWLESGEKGESELASFYLSPPPSPPPSHAAIPGVRMASWRRRKKGWFSGPE